MSTAKSEFDIVQLLLARWRALVIGAILGAGLGVAYALLAPEWYAATLTVVPSQKTPDAGALASKLPAALEMVSTDVQRIQAVLTSNSVGDEVITKFNLMERYSCAHIEHARRALWEHCQTSVDKKSSVVALSCEDKDPEQARAMAAYFGEVGNRVFARISSSSAREERRFLEKQVVKAREDVDESSKKLREFQEQHRIIDLGEQTKATISAMASIEGELVSKELQLSYLTSFSSRTEANVVQLQQQIAVMQAKLRELEAANRNLVVLPPTAAGSGSAAGSAAPADQSKFFPEAMQVPELRFQLEQLMREQKIKETVFFLLTQRYETAKVDEARDTSTFQILDNPTLPTFRSRPQRRKVVVLGLAGGLCIAAALVLLPAWRRHRLRATVTA